MTTLNRILAGTLIGIMLAGACAGAAENPPDNYLCYQAASGANTNSPRIGGVRVDLQDRIGGTQRFVLRGLGTLCNAAGIDGSLRSHTTVHLVGITLKNEKSAPKFVPSTLDVTDRFGTRTLGLTGLASVLDITPVQPGTNAPADFSDDLTNSAVEVNRFKCYTAALPKSTPKLVLPPPTVVDDAFPNSQPFLITKVRKLCVPANLNGATPGAAARDGLLVCYTVKLPRGAKFARQTVGTRSRSVGVRIVSRRKPAELCVVGRVFSGR